MNDRLMYIPNNNYPFRLKLLVEKFELIKQTFLLILVVNLLESSHQFQTLHEASCNNLVKFRKALSKCSYVCFKHIDF